MAYHFISDDSYFLQGVYHLKLLSEWKASFIQAYHLPEKFRPDLKDIIVINIKDINLRYHLLRQPSLAGCRVVIMFNDRLLQEKKLHRNFPWGIPDNLCRERFLFFLSKAVRTPLSLIQLPDIGRWVFRCLGNGYSLSDIAEETGFSVSYLHGLKMRLLKKCGLGGGHAHGILYCRDLVTMHQKRSAGRLPSGMLMTK